MNARALAAARQDQEIEASKSRAIAAREEQRRPRNALEAMAMRLNVSPAGLKETLLKTVFAGCKSDAEFIALTVVSNEYGLNPLTKEIYAFPAKGGGIVPMVSVDGWIRIMNEHPQFDGIEFDYIADQKGNIDAIEAIIHRKDRRHPIKVIEYLDECRRATDPWKQMPRRMLRNRALIQGARIAFGFSGIVAEGDEIEFASGPMIEARNVTSLPSAKTLAEELDDEIPRFDRETGEVYDAPTTDARGMTEVDEDAARALDAGEGADEADQGDADEASDPKAAALEGIKAQIGAAKNERGLKAVEGEWLKIAAMYDDAEEREVDDLLRARRAELRSEGGGAK